MRVKKTAMSYAKGGIAYWKFFFSFDPREPIYTNLYSSSDFFSPFLRCFQCSNLCSILSAKIFFLLLKLFLRKPMVLDIQFEFITNLKKKNFLSEPL